MLAWMSETDPHIHVEQRVIQAGADFRNALTSMFGLAADAPSEVTTGCDRRVPYAMTSHRPESVTCLACRDYAHREFLKFADQIERLSQLPGMNLPGVDVAEAAKRLRATAERFSS
jgi:hypothetical protein